MKNQIPEEYRQQLENALGSTLSEVRTLSLGNNAVYLICVGNDEMVAKFYTTSGIHVDNEILMHEILPKSAQKYLKKLIFRDSTQKYLPVDFAIFERVEGEVLLNMIDRGGIGGEQLDLIVEQILDFLTGAFSVQPKGFGYLKGSVQGSHESWMDFLCDYQVPTSRTLMRHPQTRRFSSLPFYILQHFYDEFDIQKPVLCPIDLNLSNFMVTPSGNLIVVDPGSVVSGNPIVCYGEFAAHTFGTPLYECLVRSAELGSSEIRLVRACAALSNMNVLAFIVRSGLEDLSPCKPWGNPNAFFDLIEMHCNAILPSELV